MPENSSSTCTREACELPPRKEISEGKSTFTFLRGKKLLDFSRFLRGNRLFGIEISWGNRLFLGEIDFKCLEHMLERRAHEVQKSHEADRRARI